MIKAYLLYLPWIFLFFGVLSIAALKPKIRSKEVMIENSFFDTTSLNQQNHQQKHEPPRIGMQQSQSQIDEDEDTNDDDDEIDDDNDDEDDISILQRYQKARTKRAFGKNEYLLPENFRSLRRKDIPVTYRLHDDLLRYYR
uniref:Uncharacterized protein n=1 Tax=Panagrolaimus sp. ES5 TaxID=591445 RepID=A0AC34GFV8_9BILA